MRCEFCRRGHDDHAEACPIVEGKVDTAKRDTFNAGFNDVLLGKSKAKNPEDPTYMLGYQQGETLHTEHS